MEKFDLLVLLLDRDSLLFDASGEKISEFKKEYALVNATLVAIYIGEKASRVISGQQFADIDILPVFDDSDGRADAVIAIRSWVYEAQANMYSGSTVKLRTAIFVDVCYDILNARRIEPAEILGGLDDTEYFQINRHTGIFELIKVSNIAKLEALANDGDAKALYELGLACFYGDGVRKDELRAQMLFYKAYLRGNIDAIFALVDLFNEPVEHFRKEAAKFR